MLTKVLVSTIYSFTNLQAYFQNCRRFYLRAESKVCKCERGSTLLKIPPLSTELQPGMEADSDRELPEF